MLLSKIYFRIRCFLKIILYKIYFGPRLKIGFDSHFRKNFGLSIEHGAKVEIGRHTSFNRNCSVNALRLIKIGDYVMFGENVKLYDHNHAYQVQDDMCHPGIYKYKGYTYGSIIIEDNVWIGSNVTILKNVTIGKNSVIGANCLLYKSIPEGSLVKSNVAFTLEPIRIMNIDSRIGAEG